MAYSPLWESLASVLKRVVATSISRKEAQEQIANAIADRAIAVRVTIDASAPDIPGWVLEGSCVGVPQQLSPKDFDWARSRPSAPWMTADMPFEGHVPSWLFVPRSIGLVEVLRADVSSIWRSPMDDQEHTLPETAASETAAGPSQRRPLALAQLQKWYETHVRDWPQGEKHPSESDDWKAAKAAFPMNHVTRDRIRALRGEHAPAEWKASGRRSARK